jgi:phospho-N-acetylmuramoyl-pentapeptide-transferase
MGNIFTIFNVVRIFTVATLGFFIAMVLTPLWTKVLYKYKLGKQLRTEGAPIFNKLHRSKEGTPTMGGVVIWVTVAILTLFFWFLSRRIDGFWAQVNFFSRGQTWLPFGALIVAALFGLLDDILGILRIGPKGGGIRMSYRLLLYTLVAAGGAF